MDNKAKFKPLVVIQCYEDRHLPPQKSKRQEAPHEKSFTLQTPQVELTPPPPPPPPPLQPQNPASAKSKTPPPVPAKYSTLSYCTKDDYHNQPPPCPTPDYDTISINSTKTLPNQNDSVEMESLESYTLNHPASQPPKPPSTYFNKPPLGARLSNGSVTSTASSKKQRPVSVTIGEYASGSLRRQPRKLDFLGNGNGEGDGSSNDITTQFASELAHTLRRSNLRRRTESMENLLNRPQIHSQTNGAVTISLNNTNKIPDSNKSNRVTINICSMEKKSDVPNGILKNGNGNHNFHTSNHKPLVQQKSITFGEMPTVINDQLLQA